MSDYIRISGKLINTKMITVIDESIIVPYNNRKQYSLGITLCCSLKIKLKFLSDVERMQYRDKLEQHLNASKCPVLNV